MASITKRAGADGSVAYQAKIRRQGHPTVTRTFDAKKDAERWAREVETAIDRNSFVDLDAAQRTTMHELFGKFESEIATAMRGKHVKPALRALDARLGSWSAAALTPARVAAFRDARLGDGVAGETVRKELFLLSRICELSIKEWGISLPANPVKLISKPPPSRSRERRLNDEFESSQLFASLAQCQSQYMLPIVKLAIETGMRQGELLSLQWQHVDLKKRVVLLLLTKNGDSRAVPLSTAAVKILVDLKKSADKNDQVFPITQSLVVQAWGHACKRAKIDNLRFHDLRHEALSRLAERGSLSMLELAAVSGHKTMQMLKRYTHLRAEDIAKKLH